MMDGVSTMDTGSNGAIVQMNTESIAEVKILVPGIPGRIRAVERAADHARSARAARTGSAAPSTTCGATPTGTPTARRTSSTALPKPISKQQGVGYSIGGPIGKPGGNNKLFFFYALEFLPRTGGNDVFSFRMPTELERQGDFSQTPRQHRQPVPVHQGPEHHRRVLGGEPGRLLRRRRRARPDPGERPLPAGPEHPEDVARCRTTRASRRPGTTIRSSGRPRASSAISRRFASTISRTASLRVSVKYQGGISVNRRSTARIPGFNDSKMVHPRIGTEGVTVNYSLSPTTFIEATYGRAGNQLAGVRPDAQLLQRHRGPDQRHLQSEQRRARRSPAALPGRVGPQQGLLRVQHPLRGERAAVLRRDQDPEGAELLVGQPDRRAATAWARRRTSTFPASSTSTPPRTSSISLTKVMGRHTLKTGFYNSHSLKRGEQRRRERRTTSGR